MNYLECQIFNVHVADMQFIWAPFPAVNEVKSQISSATAMKIILVRGSGSYGFHCRTASAEMKCILI